MRRERFLQHGLATLGSGELAAVHLEEPTACNLCGRSMGLDDPSPDAAAPHGLVNASAVGGYCSTPGNGSGALDDLDCYTFSLCEFCLDWLFCACVVPPAVRRMHLATLFCDGTAMSLGPDPFVRCKIVAGRCSGHMALLEGDGHPFEPALRRARRPERHGDERFTREAIRRASSRCRARDPHDVLLDAMATRLEPPPPTPDGIDSAEQATAALATALALVKSAARWAQRTGALDPSAMFELGMTGAGLQKAAAKLAGGSVG